MEAVPQPGDTLQVTLPDVEATEAFGAALAHEVQRGDVIFLRGELGSGKTSLARGFMRCFFGNPGLDVPSPSYLLHFSYSSSSSMPRPLEAAPLQPDTAAAGQAQKFTAGTASLVDGCSVHHIDPYRLPEGKIAALIDFETIFGEVALVEWPERLGEQLVKEDTPPRLVVTFEGFGPQAEGRSLRLSAVGHRWQEAIARWKKEGGPMRSKPSDPLPTVEAESACQQPETSQASSPASLQSCLPRPADVVRNCRPLPADPLAWRVLGIESSCDDTGAAILRGDGKILGEALASQAGIHEQWGGVVPRLAQEGHRKAIDTTVEEALKRAGVAAADLTAVAVTVGPGLGLCLEVGVRKALQIAAQQRLPLVRVHHMEAHTLVTRLPPATAEPSEGADAAAVDKPLDPAFPFLTLLVSGGHNMSVLTRGVGHHTILGSTIDDSIGEAFDKTARVLGITQVPGGPHLEKLARDGDSEVYSLPKPLSKTRDQVLQHGCDYSFSGLKTAVRTLVDKVLPKADAEASNALSEEQVHKTKADVAAAFQKVAVKHLCERASRAAEWALELEPSAAALVVAGGVAANQSVRKGLQEVAEDHSLVMRCPPPRLCVDNGVMVAWAGIERLRLGLFEEPPSAEGVDRHVEIRPRWPLGERDPRSQQQKNPKGQKRKRPAASQAEAAA